MWTVFKDILILQIRPQILFLTVIYVLVLVAWVIGVNTTFSQIVLPPPYSFGPPALAGSWAAPLIGALMGELCTNIGWLYRPDIVWPGAATCAALDRSTCGMGLHCFRHGSCNHSRFGVLSG